jgi:hypothetical protein
VRWCRPHRLRTCRKLRRLEMASTFPAFACPPDVVLSTPNPAKMAESNFGSHRSWMRRNPEVICFAEARRHRHIRCSSPTKCAKERAEPPLQVVMSSLRVAWLLLRNCGRRCFGSPGRDTLIY